jgi:hypothetical protein
MRRAVRLRITSIDLWTKEEDEIVKQVYATGTPIKCAVKNLPGRSHFAIRRRAEKLNLTGTFNGTSGSAYSWVEDAIRKELMSEGVPMTVCKLAERIGASVPGVRHTVIRKHGKGLYIGGWEKTTKRYAACWMVGDKEDVPMPIKITNAERCRMYRRQHKIKAGKISPFAAAAGLVTIPEGQRGRVFQQSMKLSDFDEELAA